MAEDSVKEIHAIVHGRVQGVGFRVTARYHALKFGIKGTVHNLPDGTVEIYAQGNQKQIDQFIHSIKEDIGHMNIKSLVIVDLSIINQYNTFEII